jgi:hypothetical protein
MKHAATICACLLATALVTCRAAGAQVVEAASIEEARNLVAADGGLVVLKFWTDG